MPPTVSILLPNLNNRSFLEERLNCIVQQTLPDWELIVVDNHSDDGAWELFQSWAERDERIKISQAPREGMYANWNNCVRKATGQSVYIATSDDTMAPDCLARMSGALQSNPECDLAHCRLKMIDHRGHEFSDWWETGSLFARSSPGLLDRDHVRLAPFDGLLHLSGETVYISITQLLIRRSLFDRIGLFENRWGSVGDFNWCMRASLVANTLHVAGTWGGWRVYPEQATAMAALGSPEHAAKIDEMIDDALAQTTAFNRVGLAQSLVLKWADEARQHRRFSRQLNAQPSALARKRYLISSLLAGWKPAWRHVSAKWSRASRWHESAPEVIRAWLRQAGVGSALVPRLSSAEQAAVVS